MQYLVDPKEYYSWDITKKIDYESTLTEEEKLLFIVKKQEYDIKTFFGIELNTHEKWALRVYNQRPDSHEVIHNFMMDYFGFSVQEFYLNPYENDIYKHPKIKVYLKEKSKLWRDERELI
ncbi:MAG: hypothetical protein NUV46_03345 [Nanoarchaeota archaeon]|nr:hypothetical protein [Nanoarchaeota archaeon]